MEHPTAASVLRALRRGDAVALARLPPPHASTFARTGEKTLLACSTALYDAYVSLFERRLTFPTNEALRRVSISRQQLWTQVFLVLTSYRQECVTTLLRRSAASRSRELPFGTSVEQIHAFFDSVQSALRRSRYEGFAGQVLVEYENALFRMGLFALFINAPMPRAMLAAFESAGHDSLARLHAMASQAPTPPLRFAADRLVQGLLGFWKDLYEATYHSADPSYQHGPYSALRLDEISALARRDRAMAERYGASRIARVFEQQLFLLMQSLGMVVVPTQTGQPTADLLCVGSPDGAPSFLVEAKTSARPYSLPSKDARALRDYVTDVRRRLTTLPPLGFVLIVGPTPASTLANKLRKLERDLALPVRYSVALALANLREALPGPIPQDAFARSALDGPHVLPNDFAQSAVLTYRATVEAHVDFVRSLLRPSVGSATTGEGWPPFE